MLRGRATNGGDPPPDMTLCMTYLGYLCVHEGSVSIDAVSLSSFTHMPNLLRSATEFGMDQLQTAPHLTTVATFLRRAERRSKEGSRHSDRW